MAKKMVILVIAIVALLLPSIGCLSDDITASSLIPTITKAQATADSAKSVADAAKASADKANAALESKVSVSTFNDLSTKVAGMSGANSYSKSETYTKAEVDAVVAKAISDYKASVGSTSSSSSSSTGSTTSSSNGFNISLEKNAFYSMTTGTSPTTITMTITNVSGAGKQCTPYLRFNAQSPSAYEKAKVTQFDVKSNISGSIVTTTGTVQSMQDITTLTNQIVWVLPSFWLDNGAQKTVWLEFTVKTTDMVTWKLEAQSF